MSDEFSSILSGYDLLGSRTSDGCWHLILPKVQMASVAGDQAIISLFYICKYMHHLRKGNSNWRDTDTWLWREKEKNTAQKLVTNQ